MAVFAQSSVDDCCGYAQPAEALAALPILGGLTQVWGEWSLSGILSAARGVPYIGALASALYIPSAGTSSARIPGRDEFRFEEELRKKALVGGTATTRVRFFWGTDIHGKSQVYGVHTGEGTPYENVRVANMLWNDGHHRYEFTPAHDVDGPLITWTPENPATGDVPKHTGSDVPPLDQPTILVTPSRMAKMSTPRHRSLCRMSPILTIIFWSFRSIQAFSRFIFISVREKHLILMGISTILPKIDLGKK